MKDPAGEREPAGTARRHVAATCDLLRSAHVWLLAPTWIAINASIGLWFSQSIFQFAQANPDFPDQVLMRGFTAVQISAAAIAIGLIFGAGLLYWGNRFKNLRRTTIILYGIVGGGVLVAAGLVINHAGGLPLVVPIAAARRRRVRPVRACRRDPRGPRPARRHLGALPERPRRDHGAVLGLPRDRPDHRCADRRIRG